MIILLKEFALLSIALFTAVLATLGISPQPAVAPDIELPAIITEEELEREKSEEDTQVATSTIETGVSQGTDGEPSLPQEEETSIDPFQDLADAFSRLADETEIRQTEVPQTQTPRDINTLARSALVNIICTTKTAGALNPISASGVVIDPQGIILTNAHVAQYFLLQNYPAPGFIDCSIRVGSPARVAYSAELLFLPPSWIQDNAHKIDDETPTGNGEHDYALVRITGRINQSFPELGALPFFSVALNSPRVGTNVTVAGYPAGFLGGATIQTELYAASSNTQVGQLYTFGTQAVDLFSVGGSIVAQQGSSGGPVARSDGALVGLIVTSSSAPNTAGRDLRALSTEYIIRDFESEAGVPLEAFFNLNLAAQAASFQATVAPALTKALTDVLNN